MDDLRTQLKKIQDTLERETLSKVDLQNQIQSLREDLAFKKKVYEEVLDYSIQSLIKILACYFCAYILPRQFLYLFTSTNCIGTNYCATYWLWSFS